MYKEVKELKKLINNYNFISNMLNLKSLKKAEMILNTVQSRCSDFYRTVERDERYSKDESKNKNNGYLLNDKSRNYTVHKNFLKNKDNKDKGIIQEYFDARQTIKYSTKLNKSILKVLERQLERQNIQIQIDLKKENINKVDIMSIEIFDLYNKDNVIDKIPLMSELEKDYIMYFLGYNLLKK